MIRRQGMKIFCLSKRPFSIWRPSGFITHLMASAWRRAYLRPHARSQNQEHIQKKNAANRSRSMGISISDSSFIRKPPRKEPAFTTDTGNV